MPSHQPWTFYLVRDSNSLGELSPLVGVWYRKPIRRRLAFAKGYTWIPSDPDGMITLPEGVDFDTGFYGDFTIDHCLRVFGTVPDDDYQVVRCEQMVPVGN